MLIISVICMVTPNFYAAFPVIGKREKTAALTGSSRADGECGIGGVRTMGKADCRKKNMCIFCEAWLGEPADTNFATGMSRFSNAKGFCKNDGEMHSPEGLCRDFEKSILYL